VYCTQPILPSQYLAAGEDPSPSFLSDRQGILTGCTLLPTTQYSTPAPIELPEDLLLAKHLLVRRDGHVSPLAAAYDGPFLVLECSLRFFKLQVVDRLDTVSTLRLSLAPHLQMCQLHCARDVDVLPPPPSGPHRTHHARGSFDVQSSSNRHRLHSVSTLPADLPALPDHQGGIWSAASTSDARDLGGSCGEMTFEDASQLCRPIYFIHI
jgi:hypothetical protein